ncbi:hypothetical protein SM60511_20280 [Xanthomonas hortorum pv. gardneri]|nr:hypothetical protein SM60511_20280 [Xanthomonas hortorum pv. gardneri]
MLHSALDVSGWIALHVSLDMVFGLRVQGVVQEVEAPGCRNDFGLPARSFSFRKNVARISCGALICYPAAGPLPAHRRGTLRGMDAA